MIVRKRNHNIVQLKRRTTTTKNDLGAVIYTHVDVWEGPYSLLQTHQNAIAHIYNNTELTPTEAEHGRLTATLIIEQPPQNPDPVIEIEWVELRKPLKTHPKYATITDAEHDAIEQALQSNTPPTGLSPLAQELYSKLRRGQTEWAIGVPIVRRTEENLKGNFTNGAAWIKDTPPSPKPAGYDWMKTADRRTRRGKTYTKVEEWTGADLWDPDIYS